VIWVSGVAAESGGDVVPPVDPRDAGSLLLEDFGVPLPRLAELVGGVTKIPADAAMTERANKAFGDIMDLAMGLGGTNTGEHGVGRLKKPWLAGQIGPEAMELNRRIKAPHRTPTESSTRAY
jgi:glycolate oxidase